MNRKFNKRIEMFWAVMAVLNKNKTLWENLPVFVLLVKEFGDLAGKIDMTAQIAGVVMTGVTSDKNATLENLAGATYEMALALALYARRTGNADLLAKADVTESDLNEKRQSEVLRLALELLDLAKSNRTELATYGVDDKEIGILETLVTEFSQALPDSAASHAGQKAAHERLAIQVGDADQLLRSQLDYLVERQRTKAPDFVKAYFNARKVVDTGVRHEKKPENGVATGNEK